MRRWLLSGILLGALWLALTWGLHRALSRGAILGADFWTVWLGARATFVEGLDPYGPQVTQRSQQGIYGRLARPDEDQVRFAYPLSAVVPLAAWAWLPYDWAYAAWLAFHLMAILGLARWAFPRLPAWMAPTLLLFFPVLRDLWLGQYSLWITEGTWLLWGWWQRRRGRVDAGWGAGLALLLGKPQEGLLWALLGVWAAVRYRAQRALQGLLVALALLVALPMLWQPTWPAAWVRQTYRYWQDNTMPNLVTRWAERALGAGGFALLVGLALILWGWIGWRWGRGRSRCVSWLALTAWITTLLHPQTNTTAQVAYVLPLWAWINARPTRPRLGLWLAALILPWALFLAFFQGSEPPQVSLGLLSAFGLWTLGLVGYDLYAPPAPEEAR